MSEIFDRVRLPEGKLIAGVSGGVDSMFLLALCIRSGREVVAVHVNYGKRAQESDADEKLVRDYCKMQNVPLFVKPFKTDSKGNFQQLARDFRYAFFEEVREATKSDFIITAHHSSDNDESLLMQLFRGASPFTLTGIPETRGQVYRPLMTLSKDIIIDAARELQVPWREDESNTENEYTRNRIRNSVIPELDKGFPEWRTQLHQLKQRSELLSQSADALLSHISDESGKDVKRDEWLKLSSTLRKLVMQRWVLGHTSQAPTAAWLDSLGALEQIQTGAGIDVHNGWVLMRNRDDFTLQHKSTERAADNSELRFTREQAESGIEHQTDADQINIITGVWGGKPGEGVLELSLGEIQFPLTLRTWRAGDRIQPLGMKGSKLVSDVLTDAQIDARKKAFIQLIETFDGKICAVIFRAGRKKQPGIISQQFSCRKTGQDTLIIALKNEV